MHYSTRVRALAIAMLVVTGPAARAADDCDAAPETWQPRSAVQALAARNGWRVDRLKIDDGCYELKGHDATGRRFKARLDPASLQVLSLRHARGDRDRERARERERDRAPAAD